MYLVLWMKLPLLITLIILLVIIFILKKTWWNKLRTKFLLYKFIRMNNQFQDGTVKN